MQILKDSWVPEYGLVFVVNKCVWEVIFTDETIDIIDYDGYQDKKEYLESVLNPARALTMLEIYARKEEIKDALDALTDYLVTVERAIPCL